MDKKLGSYSENVKAGIFYFNGIQVRKNDAYIQNSHPGLEIQGRAFNSQPEALELHFSQLVPVWS